MKFGMIDQENATSLQTIEKGKNELMRLDKFLTDSQWRDRYKTGNKGCTGKRPDIL